MSSAALLLAFASLLAGGCASAPEAPPPAPTAPDILRQGALVELLRAPTVRDRVSAVADAQGRVHALIASTTLREVRHVVVGPEGVVAQETVRREVSPDRLDAAFDREGRLHLLIDTEPLVRDHDGRWQADAAPWIDAGVKVESARFVPGAPDLVWAFAVRGATLGSPGRVDWFGFGGYGGAMIWPWPTQGERAVLTARSAAGTGPWFALEPDGKSDTRLVSAGADRRGDVHLLYDRSRAGLASGECDFRDLRIGAEQLDGREAAVADRPDAASSGAAVRTAGSVARTVVPLSGRPVESLERRALCTDDVHGIAVDPDDGGVWLGQRRYLRGDRWSPTDPPPLPQGMAGRTAAGGQGSFHVLRLGRPASEFSGAHMPVRYLRWSTAAGWSAPLELGSADVSSFWGWVWTALAIAAVGPDRAFVIWPTEEAIVGRWVERTP